MIRRTEKGFSIIELLVVIAIIGILSSMTLATFQKAKGKAYFGRAQGEFMSMADALELYRNENEGTYPPDANRQIPPGLEAYLATADQWPNAPWPGSVYDWDNWVDSDTEESIYQISIRFCPVGGPLSACSFPDEDWAVGFGVNSAVYYCIEGACRAHINESVDYPGYCVNCANQ